MAEAAVVDDDVPPLTVAKEAAKSSLVSRYIAEPRSRLNRDQPKLNRDEIVLEDTANSRCPAPASCRLLRLAAKDRNRWT